jgi:hypothetical protein
MDPDARWRHQGIVSFEQPDPTGKLPLQASVIWAERFRTHGFSAVAAILPLQKQIVKPLHRTLAVLAVTQ